MPFYFGDSLPDDFRVILADPALTQVYVDQWKTQLMGYGSLDEMTAEQQAEGEQRRAAVRRSIRQSGFSPDRTGSVGSFLE